MDVDVSLIYDYYKHVMPEFTSNHLLVYKVLWRIEPLSGEKISEEIGLSKPTVYKLLGELLAAGLVKRTSFKPQKYYAESPVKTYNNLTRKIIAKLQKGKEKIKQIQNNSTSISNEEYLIKRDGGQTKILDMQTRETLGEEFLRQHKKEVENTLQTMEKSKLKTWQLTGRV